MSVFRRVLSLVLATAAAPGPAWAAVDSYRFLHVTIETPWMIFVFLLLVVLAPFVLMAVLYWYFAAKRRRADEAGG